MSIGFSKKIEMRQGFSCSGLTDKTLGALKLKDKPYKVSDRDGMYAAASPVRRAVPERVVA